MSGAPPFRGRAADPLGQLVGWVLGIPAGVVIVAAFVATYAELVGTGGK